LAGKFRIFERKETDLETWSNLLPGLAKGFPVLESVFLDDNFKTYYSVKRAGNFQFHPRQPRHPLTSIISYENPLNNQ
jgi:hypothetical protein